MLYVGICKYTILKPPPCFFYVLDILKTEDDFSLFMLKSRNKTKHSLLEKQLLYILLVTNNLG